MIAPLRASHRRTVGALAAIVPLAFAAAIAARPKMPVSAADPQLEWLAEAGLLAESAAADLTVEALRLRVFVRRTVDLSDPEEEVTPEFVVLPEVDPERPDVLVYWSPASTAEVESIPEDALLLGTLAGSRPRVFLAGRKTTWPVGGALLFYSLAHGELLATAALPAE